MPQLLTTRSGGVYHDLPSMLPKLNLLQWLVVVLGLFFYGFTVFAVTRDYYLRHPPRLPAQALSQSTDMARLGQQMRAALADGDAAAAAAASSSDPAVLAQEADRLFRAQQFAAAIPLYRRLVGLAPEDVDTQNDLGLALHYAGDTTAGLEVLRAGAAAAPQAQRIHLSLGFVALQGGAMDTARKALTRARDLAPDSDVGVEAERLLGLLDARQEG
jgi:tetratricopeptide (TPR) repeat protein